MITNKKLGSIVKEYQDEIDNLKNDLKEARDLKSIIDKITDLTYNGSLVYGSMSGSIISDKIIFPDNVATYEDDILGGKVIKQESNKCIVIEKDGTVKTGITKQDVDKNYTYKLVRK